MQWELIATWLGLGITASTGIFFVGKQSQKIEDLEEQMRQVKEDQRDNVDQAIKLATMETDLKYLVQSISDIKDYIKTLTGAK
jgi:hypothetical protein